MIDPSDKNRPEQDPSAPVEHFVHLLTENQRRLHAYVCALLPYRADAEDVLQETNLALWRKCEEYDASRDFLRWACGVAYFEVLRHRRRYAKSRLLFSEDLLREIADEVLMQPDVVEFRHQALANCLKKLKPKDRMLIEHRYREGVTALQTSQDLGRPASTVYKALARIRRTLGDCIRRVVGEYQSNA